MTPPDASYLDPPAVDLNHADEERFDYSDEDIIRDLVEGNVDRALPHATRAHLALAFIRVVAVEGAS